MEPQAAAPATNTNAGAAPLPNIPSSWPGAFGIYKFSKQAVKNNLSTILVLVLISLVLSGLPYAIKFTGSDLLSTIISLIITVAIYWTYLVSVRGNNISVGDAFKKCQPMLVVKLLVASLLIAIALTLSFIALIVPFFFVLPRLLLAPYYLIDKDLGIMESIQTSWDATKGHSSKIWGIIGVNLLIGLLLLTIIGIPFAIYFWFMYQVAFAVAYEYINKQTPATQPVAAPTATPAAPTPPPAAPTAV